MFASSTVSFVPGSKAITFFRQLFRISKDSGCPVYLYQAKVNNWSLLHVVPDTHRDTNSTLVVQLLHTTVVSLWFQQRHRDPTCLTSELPVMTLKDIDCLYPACNSNSSTTHCMLTMTCRQACCRSCFWSHWKRLQPALSPTGAWTLTQHQTLELGMEGLRLQVTFVPSSLVCKTSYHTSLAQGALMQENVTQRSQGTYACCNSMLFWPLMVNQGFDLWRSISLFGYH